MSYQLEFEPIASAAMENLGCLAPAEREYYLGLKVEKRRREWLAGRVAAKRLVKKILDEIDLPIQKTAAGIPFVQYRKECWPLSISHSGEWAVAAMSASQNPAPIGADIEKIEDRDPSWLDVAFHPSEMATTLDAAGQTRLWTLKEAISKFFGIGLSIDLCDIRFSEGSRTPEFYGKTREIWETQGRPSISLDSSFLFPGYVLSLAYAASPYGARKVIHEH